MSHCSHVSILDNAHMSIVSPCELMSHRTRLSALHKTHVLIANYSFTYEISLSLGLKSYTSTIHQQNVKPSENWRRAELSSPDEIWLCQSAQATLAFVRKLPFFR